MTERQALVLSAGAALLIGALAVVVALLTGSGAILLDGAFNVCFFIAALMTLRVARLLQRPDDREYPFGYLHFEPLINLVKGLLIIGVGLIALFDAGIALYRGGTPVTAGLALAYAAAAVALCAAVRVPLLRVATTTGSPLVQGDVENWTVNLAISAGMFVAFCLALALELAGRSAEAQLVDPILVGLVVILTFSVPARMAMRALFALLQRAPDKAIVDSIERAARSALAGIAMRDLFVRVVRPGRTIYAMIHVLLDETGSHLDVREADRLRRSIVATVTTELGAAIVDVVFTGIEEFAAPTTGFQESADPGPNWDKAH